MARKPAVGRGVDTAVYEEAGMTGRTSSTPTMPDPAGYPPGGAAGYPPDETFEASSGRRGRRSGSGSGGAGGRRWGGSGGRWWIWVGRLVLWALILVILINGIRAPFERFTADDSAPTTPKAEQGAQFPSSAASAFALQFGNVYLNYNQQKVSEREKQLKSFLPEGTDGQLGWNGVGVQQVQSVQVAGVDARDDHNAIVTLLARTADKWIRLAVPVYSKNGAMVISGRPAQLPPPTRAELPQNGTKEQDTALATGLKQTLDSFFGAYAASESEALSRFSDGPPITGLNGSVTLARIDEVNVPKGAAGRRTITVTVTWQIPTVDPKNSGAELAQTYELTMVKKNDGTWNVRNIHGATQPSTP